jgi:uncharacterized protein (TIGR02271 family)
MANQSTTPPQRAAEGETVTLPVVQEQLHVGTRLAETGRGVRVHKQVRSRPHEVDQTLWRDELDVRHVPVDRLVDAPPAARYEGDTFIVPVLEEVLVVEKRYRIKEELHITRLRHASRHQQTVPLRDEHVSIERFDDGDGGHSSSNLTKGATMAHTLAAVFEHRGDADRAKAELLSAGFSGSDVRVAAGAGGSTDATATTDDSVAGGIMHFFSSLFGADDNADKHIYSSAIDRGQVVLTVEARSDDEVDRAADIIEAFGPLDIDSPQGMSHQTTPLAASHSAYQGAQSGIGGSMQDAGSAASGAMQGTLSAGAGSMQDAGLSSASALHGTQSGGTGAMQDAGLSGSAMHGTQSGSTNAMQDAGLSGSAMQGTQSGSSGAMQDAGLAGSAAMQGTQSGSTGAMQDAGLSGSAVMQGTQSGSSGAMQDAGLAGSASSAAMQGTQSAGIGADTLSGSQTGDTGSMQRATTEEQAIPVIQEELKVGKRTVQRGGVRVYQRVIETPVQEDVTLREEHVTIERHAVDHAIAPDQVPAFQEKSFELRENAEEAVVQKTARVVEEVVVGKEVSQRQEEINDTLRSTQVEVEQITPSSVQGSDSDSGSDSDTHFRTHWQSNYASGGGAYEDYDPAYRYGSSMASTHKGRQWNDVEPDLRRDWESSYPQSGWDKFKAAIREGWDRMTS